MPHDLETGTPVFAATPISSEQWCGTNGKQMRQLDFVVVFSCHWHCSQRGQGDACGCWRQILLSGCHRLLDAVPEHEAALPAGGGDHNLRNGQLSLLNPLAVGAACRGGGGRAGVHL